MYSLENISDKIRELADQKVQQLTDRVLISATTALLAEYRVRIFDKGLDSNDAKIGSYSTKPLYASAGTTPRKISPVGKNGDTKFADGRPHKSQYFADGWKGLRSAQGRPVDTVNLNLKGSLENNLQVARLSDTEVGIVLPSQKESLKRKGQEKHWGKIIFKASPRDVQYLGQAIDDEIEAIKEL